jgi:AAA domain
MLDREAVTSTAFDPVTTATSVDRCPRAVLSNGQGRAEPLTLEGRVPWDEGLDKAGIAFQIASAAGNRIRVIAGPGTGKSDAMKRRVARLLEEKVPPEKVLAVTFTRVAAEDLHRELQKLDVPGCEELEGQTLHGLAMRILARQHVLNSVGRTPRPLNNFEQKAMYSDIAPLTGGKKKCKALVEAYEAAWARSQGDEPGFPATDEEKAFQKILIDWHLFHKSMLIGEVIPYLVRYLKDNPAADEHSEFDHVLADEYQDLNKAEQTAIAYLSEAAHICLVGDDDQSIYSFKSAHPDGIRQWKTIHAGCSDFEMAECQRCPTTVVEMANSLISHTSIGLSSRGSRWVFSAREAVDRRAARTRARRRRGVGGRSRAFQRDDEGDHPARHPAGGEGSPGYEPAQEQGPQLAICVHRPVRAGRPAADSRRRHPEGGRGRRSRRGSAPVFRRDHAREGGRRSPRKLVNYLSEGDGRQHREAARHPVHEGELRAGAACAEHLHSGAWEGCAGAHSREGVT